MIFVLISASTVIAGQTAGDSVIVNEQTISISHRLFIEPRLKLSSFYRFAIQWDAYQGFSRISKYDFLKTAGYPEQSEKIRISNNDSCQKLIIGTIAIAAGIGVHSLGDQDLSKQETRVIRTVGVGIGLTGTYFTIKGLYRLYRNQTPYSAAKQIAEDYNKKLETTYSE